MVQAMINISEDANHVLNIVKAKYKLKDKSAAIEQIAQAYKELVLEASLKPSNKKTANQTTQRKPAKTPHRYSAEELKQIIEQHLQQQ